MPNSIFRDANSLEKSYFLFKNYTSLQATHSLKQLITSKILLSFYELLIISLILFSLFNSFLNFLVIVQFLLSLSQPVSQSAVICLSSLCFLYIYPTHYVVSSTVQRIVGKTHQIGLYNANSDFRISWYF